MWLAIGLIVACAAVGLLMWWVGTEAEKTQAAVDKAAALQKTADATEASHAQADLASSRRDPVGESATGIVPVPKGFARD